MNSILNELLYVTVLSSIVILVVVIIKAVCKNNIGIKAISVLWTLVIIRLIIPFSIESPIHIGDIFKVSKNVSPPINTIENNDIINNFTDGVETGEAPVNLSEYSTEINVDKPMYFDNDIVTPAEPTADTSPTFTSITALIKKIKLSTVLFILWIAVGIAILTKGCVSLILLNRRIKGSNIVSTKLHYAFVNAIASVKMLKQVKIIESNNIDIPITYGVIYPKIIIPNKMADEIDEYKIELIIAHELRHIKSGDIIKNYLWLLAKAIHWFNPLVWIGYRLYTSDMEIVCDTKVIEHIKEVNRAEYSQSLIDATKILSNVQKLGSPVMLSFCKDESKLRRRIMNILKPIKQSKKQSALIGILIIILILCCFTTACQKSNDSTDNLVSTDSTHTITPTPIPQVAEEDNERPKTEKLKGYFVAEMFIPLNRVSVADLDKYNTTKYLSEIVVEIKDKDVKGPTSDLFPIYNIETSKIDINIIKNAAKTLLGTSYYENELIKSDYDRIINNFNSDFQLSEDEQLSLKEYIEEKYKDANTENVEVDIEYKVNGNKESIRLKSYKDDIIFGLSVLYENDSYSHFHFYNHKYGYEPVALLKDKKSNDLENDLLIASNFAKQLSDNMQVDRIFTGKVYPKHGRWLYTDDSTRKIDTLEDCYIFRFAPEVQGLQYLPSNIVQPLNANNGKKAKVESALKNPLTSEYVDIVVHDGKIMQVIWDGNSEIIGNVNNNEIISLDEAYGIFRDKFYDCAIFEDLSPRFLRIDISSIEFGLVRVDSEEETKMIPAYAFIGTQRSTFNAQDSIDYIESDIACFMIINALDGTRLTD